jgi:hypothetical protein
VSLVTQTTRQCRRNPAAVFENWQRRGILSLGEQLETLIESEKLVAITKPGPGWVLVGPAVWDHSSGLRVHSGGYCIVDGEFRSGLCWPECQHLNKCVAVCGGNRRRGVMVWALGLNSTPATAGNSRKAIAS